MCVERMLEVMAGLSSKLDPLRARAFSAVGGCYVPSRQAALMVRYTIALLCLAMSGCYVRGYVIQTEPGGLIDSVPAPPFRGS